VPTYQYACTECGDQLEAVQSFSDPALTECPACGGRLRKVFGSVGVVFKGSGFYRNDSRAAASGDKANADKANGDKANGGSSATESTKSEKPAASSSDSSSSTSSSSAPAAGSSSGSGSSGSGSSGTKAAAATS
jgi:putative FmdB family regulatory protein